MTLQDQCNYFFVTTFIIVHKCATDRSITYQLKIANILLHKINYHDKIVIITCKTIVTR